MAASDVLRSLHSHNLTPPSSFYSIPSLSISSPSICTLSCQIWWEKSSVPSKSTLCRSSRSSSQFSRRFPSSCLGESLSASCFGHSSHPFNALPNPNSPCPRSLPLFVPQAKKSAEVVQRPEEEVGAAAAGEEEEEEVEISWIQEKTEDLVLATSQAIDRVPGPRVGDGGLPWLVAVPLGYLGITFVIAVVKTIRKYNSPKGQRKRQVGKNAFLCEALGEYLPDKRHELNPKTLQVLANQCKFDMSEVLRKYIRYALNERPFTPDTVADLIHLRKVSGLLEAEVSEVLNDVARRVVKAKGPVVINTEGMTEKGIKRKAAVQALFSKLLYLSELEEFVSSENRSALTIKTNFGVTEKASIRFLSQHVEHITGYLSTPTTKVSGRSGSLSAMHDEVLNFMSNSEDASTIRIDTLSEQSDVESLERMVGSGDSESDNEEDSSPTTENS